MKKLLTLTLLLITIVTMTWCSKEEKKTDNTATSTTNTTDCKTIIQNHLSKADMKWRWDREIKNGDNIVVDYVGRLDDKEIFDTSVADVAQACGKYSTGRDYNSWLPFTVWAGQMIAGFDKWVVGMKIWQTKTITIPAKEAYGEWSSDKLAKVDKTKIPNAEQYKVGMQVMTDYWQSFKVYEISKDQITFDGNHELAGKDLTFDITIKEIK
jgi:FKBP-type peptidyl-prolyl cis-trans isomerase 2